MNLINLGSSNVSLKFFHGARVLRSLEFLTNGYYFVGGNLGF
jgi:hypothetical protein